jgi:integrase
MGQPDASAMPTDALTDAKCRSAKPQERAYKLFDGGGLHLYVSPAGARVWRLAYRRRVNGDLKPATISFGPYPEVGLAEARRRRDEARKVLRDGGDPMAPRRAARTMTLREACDAYWAGRKDITDAYRTNALRCMDMHIHPDLGDKAVAAVTRADLLGPLNRMDAAGLHDYVRKARLWLSSVFGWAIEQGHTEANPAAAIDPEKAFGKKKVEHFAALQPHEMPALMSRLSLENQHLQSLLAFRCLAYTWLRTVELRTLLKTDRIAPDMLMIPAGRMKRPRDHLVPLPPQAQVILDHMAERFPSSRYFWPGDRSLDKPMSENAVLYLLHRVGFKGRMTGHGLRSVGSTWANEAGWNPDAIELQLAHVDGSVRAIYNRARYIDERRSMLQAWATWLDAQGQP